MHEFETLLHECLGPLQRYVYYKINNRQDAEDIVQEVCLTATMKFESLQDCSLFKSWLIGIANHKCTDYYRRQAKVNQVTIDDVPEAELKVEDEQPTDPSVVLETLRLLRDKDRQILYMYYFLNTSQENIAKRLSIPVGTVKSRLHYAKEKFKQHYPNPPISKGAVFMKKLPEYLPEYTIEKIDLPPFSVRFKELLGRFIIPKIGESNIWAIYDMPGRKSAGTDYAKVVGPVKVHGIEGVEILTSSKPFTEEVNYADAHSDFVQMTDTHCRWLGETYFSNGVKHLLTFLDDDEFAKLGFGEDNCGYEINLRCKGEITRSGDTITTSTFVSALQDLVGRYKIRIMGKQYDTVCLMEITADGMATESYIDSNGRTVLWRRYNHDKWAFDRYQKAWSELLPTMDRLEINGETFVHWYDCISDYIL